MASVRPTSLQSSPVIDFASAAVATLADLRARTGLETWIIGRRYGADYVILHALSDDPAPAAGDVLRWDDRATTSPARSPYRPNPRPHPHRDQAISHGRRVDQVRSASSGQHKTHLIVFRVGGQKWIRCVLGCSGDETLT
jgi:hypothetical protein